MTDSLPFREIEFPSLPESINIIEALVERLKVQLHLSEELEANILVSLTEAVNNAIFHGNESDPRKKVIVTMEAEKQCLQFAVIDQGRGFDMSKLKDPTTLDNRDKPTGRGIFLIQHLCDRVEFLDGGKKVVITFYNY